MKRILFLSVLLFSCFQLATAQSPISAEEGFLGLKFERDGRNISFAEVKNDLKTNPEALKLVKSGRTKRIVANIGAFVGGYMLGAALGRAIGEGEFDLLSTGIGVGALGAAIPLSINGTKSISKGLTMYNASLVDTEIYERRRPSLSLCSGANRVGLALTF